MRPDDEASPLMRVGGTMVMFLFLAGCLRGGGPEPLEPLLSPDELMLVGERPLASAFDLHAVAEAAANKWDPNAKLWGAAALEPSSPPSEKNLEENLWWEYFPQADPQPADGLAQAWVFGFLRFPSRDAAYILVVGANGTVIGEEQHEADPDYLEDGPFGPNPVEDWRTDSDDAVAALTAADGTWRHCLSQPETSVAMLLLSERRNEVRWKFFLAQPGFNGGAWAVDAQTGEYEGAAVQFSCVRPPKEGGAWTGRLTALEPSQVFSFRLNASTHEFLRFVLIADSEPLPRTYNLTATDPQGNNVRFEFLGRKACAADVRCKNLESAEEPSSGEWTLTLRLLEGISFQYRLVWCAEGDPRQPPATGHPCELATPT